MGEGAERSLILYRSVDSLGEGNSFLDMDKRIREDGS